MLTGSRSTGRSSANTSMRSTSFTMRSVSSQMSRVSVRSSSLDRLLEQLRGAANARQRVLDLVGEHGGERDHRARRAAVGELAVHLVGDGALLQHHHDVVRPLRERRHMQVDDAVAGIARRAEVDLVFVDGGAAGRAPDRPGSATDCRTARGRAACDGAAGAAKPRKRLPPPHWRRRPCRPPTPR